MNEQQSMVNLQMRLSREMVDRIDKLRMGMTMRPSRTQTIRWLLENGLSILESSKEASSAEIRQAP